MKKCLIPFLLLFGFFIFRCSNDDDKFVDLAGLRRSGDNWHVVQLDTLCCGVHTKLSSDKWLMYFLHWRPLTEEKNTLSLEYAQKYLLNFWGPNMPFTLDGEAGETMVAGHPAYFVNATFRDTLVRTRFIVWNCPETQRQFVGDCNINLIKKTPEPLLELQSAITSTISCHGQARDHDVPLLNQKYQSDKYHLSLWIPENWHTSEYQSNRWFPDGLTPTNGTLWTLLTDSKKYIDTMWSMFKKEISTGTFEEFIGRLKNKRYIYDDVQYRMENIEVESYTEKKDYLVGDGHYILGSTMNVDGKEYEDSESFRFRAFLWLRDKKTYFMMASLLSREQVWDQPVDLSPSDDVFRRFVKQEVLPNIKLFKGDY